MKILTILQARTGSSRLPGKVLKELMGKPMILRQIERIQRASQIGTLCLATSIDPSDDALSDIISHAGIGVYRGSLDDVLDRFYQAALPHAPDIVVRLTGDCPLADPEILDLAITAFIERNCDYLSNCHPPTYPDGMDVEVFRFSALSSAWKLASLPSEREHVTPFIYKHPELFQLSNLRHHSDLSRLRLTVDEPTDFALVEKIYQALMPIKSAFHLDDILELLERHPKWQQENQQIMRNEGYLKSISQDVKNI